jgi:hypothetical protein
MVQQVIVILVFLRFMDIPAITTIMAIMDGIIIGMEIVGMEIAGMATTGIMVGMVTEVSIIGEIETHFMVTETMVVSVCMACVVAAVDGVTSVADTVVVADADRNSIKLHRHDYVPIFLHSIVASLVRLADLQLAKAIDVIK